MYMYTALIFLTYRTYPYTEFILLGISFQHVFTSILAIANPLLPIYQKCKTSILGSSSTAWSKPCNGVKFYHSIIMTFFYS